MARDHDLYIITGPEGAGKTTLVGTLAARGLPVLGESLRDAWRYQARVGGPCLPFAGGTAAQRYAYFEMSLGLDMRSYDEARALPDGPVICDRGMPDIVIFLEFCRLPVPAHADRAAREYRYNPVVFLAPFWPEIYEPDPERTSTPGEAASQEALCRDVYRRYGYEVITLPKATPETRADFVLACIAVERAARVALRAVG